ncbi:hypothetical protein OPIT5_00995 [Opitutaceae bacterium TAV5]|nr:hypothetical protein OPIT5_00995 [Opitutaceae bacterium TAV5]
MKTNHTKSSFAAILATCTMAGLFLAPGAAVNAATTIWSENFSGGSTALNPLNKSSGGATVIGWQGWGANSSATTTTPANFTTNSQPGGGNTPRMGQHNGVTGYDGTTNGVFFIDSTGAGSFNTFTALTADTTANTRFVSTNLGAYDSISVSWAQSFTSTSDSLHLLVKSGNSWYVSVQTFGVTAESAGGSMTNGEIKTVNLTETFGTAAWYKIGNLGNRTGETISINTSEVVSIASTDIAGIGFYFNLTPGKRAFVDDVQLVGTSNIPEPSTLAALAGLAGLAAAILIRRRR